MPLIVLSVIIQVALVVHILKTGRNTTWVFIVLFFPLVGSLAYAIVELLPGFTHSRAGMDVRRNLARTIDPDRALREAQQRFEAAGTVRTAMDLAKEHLARGQFEPAKALYQQFLSGLYATDPGLLEGLAASQFGLGEYAATIETLDRLKAHHPAHRSPEAHLLYARAREGAGDRDAARHEYEALVVYYPGPEPACRLAQLLEAGGEPERALELYRGVVQRARTAGAHYASVHKEWVSLAQRKVAG